MKNLLLGLALLSSVSAFACVTNKQYRIVKNGFRSAMNCPKTQVGAAFYYDGACLTLRINNAIENAHITNATKQEQELFKAKYLSAKDCAQNPENSNQKSFELNCTNKSLKKAIFYMKSIKDRDCGTINMGGVSF